MNGGSMVIYLHQVYLDHSNLAKLPNTWSCKSPWFYLPDLTAMLHVSSWIH